MSGIKKRTVFVDTADGYHRFADMAKVATGIGTMAESFSSIGLRHAPGTEFSAIDWADEMQRIDEIQNITLDKRQTVIGDGVHGLLTLPRTGR